MQAVNNQLMVFRSICNIIKHVSKVAKQQKWVSIKKMVRMRSAVFLVIVNVEDGEKLSSLMIHQQLVAHIQVLYKV